MKKFNYPLLNKFLFKFANIPASLLLIVYMVAAGIDVRHSLISLIPLIIAFILVYLLNRRYLTLYKVIPYTIEADLEKLRCTDFAFSKKEVIIYYKDIEKLSGGIFNGKISGMMKVQYAGKQYIGFFNSIKDLKGLQTVILSKVNRPVYDEVVANLQHIRDRQEKRTKFIKAQAEKKKGKNKEKSAG